MAEETRQGSEATPTAAPAPGAGSAPSAPSAVSVAVPAAGAAPAAAPVLVPSLKDKLVKLFGGRPVRSGVLRRGEEAAARAADAAGASAEGAEEEEEEEGGAGPGAPATQEGAGGAAGHRRGKPVRQRIGELKAAIRAEQEQRLRIEGELEALRSGRAAPVPPGQGADGADGAAAAGADADVDADPEPQPEAFETQADYIKALGRWAARAERLDAEEAEALRKKELQAAARRDKALNNWQTQVDRGRAEYGDFDAIALSPEVPYSGTMIQRVAGSELGAELALYLGRAPEEAARIAHLEPLEAVAALAKIEAGIEAGRIAIPKLKNKDGAGAPPAANAAEGQAGAAAASSPLVAAAPAPASRTRAAPPLPPIKGEERPEPDMAELAKRDPAEYGRRREKQHAEYLRTKYG